MLQATGNPDATDGESALLQAVGDLPQPNRDTLAFLILHLRRVAECRQNKMSISNLARILGPTVVGYSTADPTTANMMSEVREGGSSCFRFGEGGAGLVWPARRRKTGVEVESVLE